jgi:hypothetical protein
MNNLLKKHYEKECKLGVGVALGCGNGGASDNLALWIGLGLAIGA